MRAIIAGVLVAGLVGLAGARPDDKKADPTGTWKWETEFNGQKRETVLKLKLVGDKLTGTISGGRGGKGGGGKGGMETKIADGKFADGEVTFTVTREFNGNKQGDGRVGAGRPDPGAGVRGQAGQGREEGRQVAGRPRARAFRALRR